MGYDIHIVKTEDWQNAASDPVTKAEVDRVIAADKDLQWSQTDYMEMVEANGEKLRFPAILWQKAPTFYWFGNEITCSDPSEEQIMKMIDLAELIKANVIGDDGEVYRIKKNLFGKRTLVWKG